MSRQAYFSFTKGSLKATQSMKLGSSTGGYKSLEKTILSSTTSISIFAGYFQPGARKVDLCWYRTKIRSIGLGALMSKIGSGGLPLSISILRTWARM